MERTPKELCCCRMLLRHGVTDSFCKIFKEVRSISEPDFCDKILSDFCSASFVRLMIVAGVDFSGRQDALMSIRDMPRFEAYLNMLHKELTRPRSLQDYCVMTVRKTLSAGGQLWSKIDSLPLLPTPLYAALKLTSL